MIVVDGHLDLAMCALDWNRDLRLSALETRRQEAGMAQKGRGTGTVGFREMRAGQVALSFATVFARVAWPGSGVSGYRTQEIAYGHAMGHLAYYRQLAANGGVRLVASRADLDRHLAEWSEPIRPGAGPEEPPLGFVVSMEGADAIVSPEQVPEWWANGLRIVSLCHYGFSAYAHGTGMPGGLLPRGRPLLRAMEEVGMILDVSHLAEQAFYVDQIDHVCQVAGDARHAAIGSDLDGGYGTEQCPHDLDTIADLQKVPDLLQRRGYAEDDIRLVMHGNWVRLLREALPAS